MNWDSGMYQQNVAKKSADGKTYYWYYPYSGNGQEALTQYNVSGTTYRYMGVG